MQISLLFFLFLFGAYTLSALLCVPFGEYVTEAAGVPIHKFIGRGGLLLALLGFWPLLKALRLANRHSLGYDLPGAGFRLALAKSFVVGVLILVCLALTLLALGIRIIPSGGEPPLLLKVLAQGLIGGLAVGFIEETFFRGAMFSAIRRRGGHAVTAIALPALLYATLHFLKPQPFPADAEVTLVTTLTSLANAFPALLQMENLDSFAALLVVGVFLGVVRHRSGHIAWCIGLHAGWVLVIRLTHKYTDLDPGAPLNYLVGTYDGVIGWLAAGWIGLLALGIALWPKNRSEQAAA